MLLKTYYPMPKFPPISLSGAQCRLSCEHCNRAYLRGMAPATTDAALYETCKRLADEGAIGVLLSGGSDRDGSILNLRDRVATIRRIKAETGLILNLHPGLMDAETAEALGDVIDFASVEIPSDETIRDVFRLDATRDDYVATYDALRAAGIRVAPHVTVYEGGEERLLEGLAPPEVVTVIVFSPTRDTPMADVTPPSASMVGDVIRGIKAAYPTTEISLGCMRPRTRDLRVAIEVAALDAGATRMVLPSRETLDLAEERGYEIARFDACCALPKSLEPLARHDEG
ncbi:MAG: radical SAM protein [Anaerolineae bacterium]